MKKLLLFFLVFCFTLPVLFSGCTEIDTPSQTANYYDSNNLQGCWMFEEDSWTNESNHTLDYSSDQQHGTIHQATQETNNILGTYCASFNGTDQYITISNSNLNLQQFTVEAWVKSPHPGNDFSYILSKGGQNCDKASYAFYTDSNSGLCFYISDEITALKSPNPGSTIWDNEWHHIAGTYNGEIIRLYVDGEEIQEGTPGNLTISYNLSDGNNLIIGNYLGTCQLPYKGLIDNVMIWNIPLSSSDIYQHYIYGLFNTNTQQQEPQYVSFQDARSYLISFLSPYNENNILVIKGDNLSLQNNLFLTTIASQMDNTKDINIIKDTQLSKELTEDYGLLILLGSERTNNYANDLKTLKLFTPINTLISPPLVLEFGTHTTTHQDLLIVYTTSETQNLRNRAAEKSPLSSFIDKKYVPAIATSISISLLYLWSIFGNTITEFIFDYVSEHIAERKIRKIEKYGRKRETTKQKRIIYELITLLFAVLVFSVAMSWTWSESNTEFLSLFKVNLLLISVVFLIREGLRLYLSKRYALYTEHIIWPFGSILTLGSTILGNTFSLASFTLLSTEEDQKKYGKMYYQIFKVLYSFCLILYIINFFSPSVYFQMFYVFIIMSLLIDMTPCEPMDGLDIKQWNKKKWIGFYILIIISYLFMNFSLTFF